MELNDIIQVHIWQLPEKITDIEKDVEYTIINDGFTKKVSMKRLYEYFNQDYKVDSTERYFDETLYTIDKEYNPQYISLELSLDEYEGLVQRLVDCFKVNRDDIRSLETGFIKSNNSLNDTITIFEDLQNKQSILMSTLDNFQIIVFDLKSNTSHHSIEIESLRETTSELINDISQLYIDSGNMKDQINDTIDNIKSVTEDKKESLINDINAEYDRIINIIDHYHHIHDQQM